MRSNGGDDGRGSGEESGEVKDSEEEGPAVMGARFWGRQIGLFATMVFLRTILHTGKEQKSKSMTRTDVNRQNMIQKGDNNERALVGTIRVGTTAII